MKKAIMFLAIFAVCVASVFADSIQSEYSYTNIPLYKIYNHQNGYVALYTKDGYNISTVYLPMAWFKSGVLKGKMINLPKGLYPYMTVVYKNKEFQYVTLAVPRNPSDDFWGILPADNNVADKFNVDTIVLE